MKLSVFIVDDDKMLGMIQKALVASVWPGDEPTVCYDGAHAIELIDRAAASGKKIILLLDINMPEMDGWEVLDQLSTRHYSPNVWVVLNTSSEELADEIKSKSYRQVIAFNRKPLTREVLRKLMVQEPLMLFF